MKSITQQEPMGCGVACVAAILGGSYASTRKLFAQSHHSISRGYYCQEIVDVLCKRRIAYRFARVDSKNTHLLAKEGTIVFVARNKRYPAGHFVLKTKKGWMNSWINFPTITPARSGFEKKLPGKAEWIIYPV